MLFDSGYDMRMSTYYGPDSTDLSDSPRLRSKFQEFIGKQNLELKLNKLAADPRVQQSMAIMQNDLRTGNKGLEPMQAYLHNKLIKAAFNEARYAAWAQMMQIPEVEALIRAEQQKKVRTKRKLDETSALLQMNR